MQGQIKLSSREVEVVVLICKEYTTKQIGDILNISCITANNHRSNIMKKLNTNNMVGVVLFAIRNGIYSP